MRFSQKFKSSTHCLPSPDGRLVATLLASEIHIRSVDHLEEVVNAVSLPSDLPAAAVVAFQWSPSSERLLVATSDQILVASALSSKDELSGNIQPFRAVIRNPSLPVVAKPTYVGFGPASDHICLCSAFGIKFAVFNLKTGKTVEVSNPKLYSSVAICRRGFSYRPDSHHLAILTRTASKDWISIHDPLSTAVAASWSPDTIDAQGLVWSPDGRWLVVWESPAHGHKILLYTPDGHLFKTWTGSFGNSAAKFAVDEVEGQIPYTLHSEPPTVDESLGSGVRLVQFSADSRVLAVGDASRCIRIIDMASIVGSKRLLHPMSLVPTRASFTIWQEQIDLSSTNVPVTSSHVFVEATQDVSPPGRPASASSDATISSSGCSLMAIDCSSALLVTRLEEAPSTVWVWNLETSLLSAVLMLHASVSNAVWHPNLPQTLLVTCEGDKHRGLGVVWSPLHGPPQVADFSHYYPLASNDSQQPAGGNQVGKYRPTWLRHGSLPPSLFFSDGHEFALVALDEESRYNGVGSVPWREAAPPLSSSLPDQQRWALDERAREESPLILVPAEVGTEDDSELEDTFHYKKEE